MKIFLIGGTGTISRTTTAVLLAEGNEVTLYNRSKSGSAPAGAKVLSGDRNDRGALAEAIDSVRPDALIDFVCFIPEEAKALADAVEGKVGHLIFVSTVDAFGFPQPTPIVEGATRRLGVGAYALAKQACEDLLLERHRMSGLPLTIARPTYSMGERFVISLFNHSSVGLMQRLRRGELVVLPDKGGIPIHPSDATDTGRMIAAMAGAPQAVGKTYTAGSRGTAMPQRAYVDLIARVVGVEPMVVSIPIEEIDAMRLSAAENTVFSNVTRFRLDFAFDRFEADFPDFRWQPDLEKPIRKYLARIERDGQMAGPLLDDLETTILANWKGRS